MTDDQIHHIDRLIGQRLTEARNAIKMTQAQLGDAIGVTFQQIQKYERGTNRMAASRLHDAAIALGVDISHFYEGTPATRPAEFSPEVQRLARLADKLAPPAAAALADFVRVTTEGR